MARSRTGQDDWRKRPVYGPPDDVLANLEKKDLQHCLQDLDQKDPPPTLVGLH